MIEQTCSRCGQHYVPEKLGDTHDFDEKLGKDCDGSPDPEQTVFYGEDVKGAEQRWAALYGPWDQDYITPG